MKGYQLKIEGGLSWVNAFRRLLFLTGLNQAEVQRFLYDNKSGWASYQRETRR